MGTINPYNPQKIILMYPDVCKLCKGKMRRLSEGMWRGSKYGMMHVECYDKFLKMDINELLNW